MFRVSTVLVLGLVSGGWGVMFKGILGTGSPGGRVEELEEGRWR